MGDRSPDWIADAVRQTRRELAAFVRTTVEIAFHPARLGRRWTEIDATDLNPLGYAATAFGLVGVIGAAASEILVGADESKSTPVREVLSWLLPYAYFVLLGVIQHVCLKLLFRSPRRLRDSCAMSLYAGGGVGMPIQLLAIFTGITLKKLGAPTQFDLGSGTFTMLTFMLLASASILLFFVTLGAAQSALHRMSAWKIVVATLIALLVTSLLFGYFKPPGQYGVHLALKYTFDDGLQIGLGN